MLALNNGKIMTMAGPVIENGSVIIKDQIVESIGSTAGAPAGAQIIDTTGKYVLPGLIDAHTHVGILQEIYPEGDDINETSDPVTPQLRAIDAIKMDDLAFADAVRGGVTTVMTGPGSANIISGTSLVMKTWGKTVDRAVLKNPAGLKVALGENPKRVYSEQKKTPLTRMANAAILREALVDARNYEAKMGRSQDSRRSLPERSLKWEAMLPVLRGELPLFVHAHQADDIMTALRIADEFGIRISIHHCTEGHKIPGELAQRGIPAIVGPIITNRAKVELKNRTLTTAGILARSGVKVAIMTDHPVVPIQYLSLSAALAVRGGLDETEALRAITINAAQILGVDDRVGSLAPGKDADLIVTSGNPLDWRSRVELVIINGEIVYAGGDYAGLDSQS
jgi:imidazolonepropionase-like amidohydrolase